MAAGKAGKSNEPGAATGSRVRSARRVAGYALYPFYRKALDPIVGSFAEHIISGDLGEIEAFRPDVIVLPEATSIPRLRDRCDARHALVVAMRHGGENKYIAPEQEYALADYVCGSEWDRQRFDKFAIQPRRGFLLTGNPWVDEVFRLPPRDTRRDAPTVLFAPTFHPETSAATLLEGQLVQLVRGVYPESCIIIKPHPHVLRLSRADDPNLAHIAEHRELFARWVRDWEEVSHRVPGVVLVTDQQVSISRFFERADILVSDGSSLILEFMALGRPILLYTSEQRVGYWTYDPDAPGNAWRDLGIEFRSADEFRSALESAFTRHDSFHRARQQQYTDELHGRYQDGRSSERAVRAIENLPWLDVMITSRGSRGRTVSATTQRLGQRLANSHFHVYAPESPADGWAPAPRVTTALLDPDADLGAVRNQFFRRSSAEHILVIDHDPAVELHDGRFLATALDLFVANAEVVAAGRLTNGVLRSDHAVFHRQRTLACGGFPERTGLEHTAVGHGVNALDAALTASIERSQCKVASAWNEEPHISFGLGFHQDEGGWRWMSEEGSMSVGFLVSGPWCERWQTLRFLLRTADAPSCPQLPFPIVVIDEQKNTRTSLFARGAQPHLMEMKADLRCGPQTVLLKSSAWFRPSDAGGADFRKLSVTISEVSVRAPQQSAADLARLSVVVGNLKLNSSARGRKQG